MTPRRPGNRGEKAVWGTPMATGRGKTTGSRVFFTRVGTPETFLFWYDSYRHSWELRRLGKCFWFQHVGLCWMSLSWMTYGLGFGMVLECLPRHSSKQILAVGNQRKSQDKYGCNSMHWQPYHVPRSHDTLLYWRYIFHQHRGVHGTGDEILCIDFATPSSNPFKYPIPKGSDGPPTPIGLSVEVRAVGFSAFWHPKIFGLAKISQENPPRVTKNMFQQTGLFNSFHVSSEPRKKKETPPTFHYSGWFMGILLMVYFNLYITG